MKHCPARASAKAKNFNWIYSMAEMVFLLKGKASAFVTRDTGRWIREELLQFESLVAVDDTIVIDASDVDALTPSFVDEFFGRTASMLGIAEFQRRFRIRGIDVNTKTLINKVVRNRLLLDAQAKS